MSKSVLIYIIFILIGNQIGAQQKKLIFKHLTQKEGLPYERDMNAITRDYKGFIWIGTSVGLYRYDGNVFKNYTFNAQDKKSPSGKNTLSIHEDKNKNLWIGTNSGFDLYDRMHDCFKHVPVLVEGTSPFLWYGIYIPFIVEDKKGEIFVGTSNSVLKLNINKFYLENYKPVIKLINKSNSINCMFIDSDNELWVGTINDGIYSFNIEQFNLKKYNKNNDIQSKLISNSVISIDQDIYGEIWIASDAGLTRLNKKTKKFTHYQNNPNNPKSISIEKLNKVYSDHEGGLWICTENGLYLYNREDDNFDVYKNNFEDETSLSGNKVHNIYADKENLWVFSALCGINYVNLQKSGTFLKYVRNPYQPNSLAFNSVTSFIEDKKGNLWIATDGGGLDYFEPEISRFTHFKSNINDANSLKSNAVVALYADRNEDLWIGTYLGGMSFLDKNRKSFITYKFSENYKGGINSNNVFDIIEDKDENILALTIDNGLNIFNRKQNKFSYFVHDPENPNSICHNAGNCLLEDSNGDIWIATYYGLSKLDRKKSLITNFFVDKNDKNSLKSNWVHTLYEDKYRNIWIGTENGLNIYSLKRQKLFVPDSLSEIANRPVNGIIEDNIGNFWFTSNDILYKYNKTTRVFQYFDYSNGIPGELNKNSIYKTKSGNIYIGSTKGFISFNPNDIKDDEKVPEVFLSDFKIFDKSVKPGDSIDERILLKKIISDTESIKLNSSENNFSFEFAAIEFDTPDKIKYAYIMSGFDKNWRYTTADKRYASYTNLNPGKYIFKVKSSMNIDYRKFSQTQIEIIILPPWWKTWWAVILYVIIIISLSFIYINISIAKIKLKKDFYLEKLKREKEIELNQMKLNFFTNITHEFRTPLTLILGPIEKLLQIFVQNTEVIHQLTTIKKSAERLLGLINELLDLRRIESGMTEFNVSKINIVDFVKQIADSYNEHARIHNIDYQIVSNPEVVHSWIDRNKFEKVIYNLLSNAFKFTPDGGTVSIQLEIKSPQDIENNFSGNSISTRHNVSDSTIVIKFQDSGIGISPESIGQIFDKFYAANTTSSSFSSGIGLALTKEIIELHKGTISVTSKKGFGSCFIVNIPLDSKNLADKTEKGITISESDIKPELPQFESYLDLTDEQIELDTNEIHLRNDAPVLLIVEDNEEVRSFIKEEFKFEYRILEAGNGLEGLNIATSELPDLIISDVMMPEMDGIELCKKIKNDYKTNHIPVILLTARVTVENRIEGLESGADSYIPKPFHPRHLQVRAKKLIELRKTLQEKYNHKIASAIKTIDNKISFELTNIETMAVDEKFLQRALSIVDKYKTDSEFSVETFCKEMDMSYIQLYRKIKALTNMTIKEFILDLRLKAAENLLRKNKFSISEVCYQVGFSSHSYFTKCFREKYGITPTEFLEKNIS